MIIDYHKPKTETEYDDRKRVVSISNGIINSLLEFVVHHKTIFRLTEKY